MDGHSGQPGLASGGSAGRSENLQGGSKGCLLGRPGEVRLPGAHWLSCRCCGLKTDYWLIDIYFAEDKKRELNGNFRNNSPFF